MFVLIRKYLDENTKGTEKEIKKAIGIEPKDDAIFYSTLNSLVAAKQIHIISGGNKTIFWKKYSHHEKMPNTLIETLWRELKREDITDASRQLILDKIEEIKYGK